MAGLPEVIESETHLITFTDNMVRAVGQAMTGGADIGPDLRTTMTAAYEGLVRHANEARSEGGGSIPSETVALLGALTGLLGMERPVDVSSSPYDGPRDL